MSGKGKKKSWLYSVIQWKMKNIYSKNMREELKGKNLFWIKMAKCVDIRQEEQLDKQPSVDEGISCSKDTKPIFCVLTDKLRSLVRNQLN